MAAHFDDLYWRLSAQYDSCTDQAEHRSEHDANSTGKHAACEHREPSTPISFPLAISAWIVQVATCGTILMQSRMCAGAIAVSGDGGSVAAIPPSARQCVVLELSHGSTIRRQTVLEPEKTASPQSSPTWVRHCALSRSGTLTALPFGDGRVSVYDRYAVNIY